MKYCVLIMDGAAGLPMPDQGGKTCLELARTPNLDAIAAEGAAGMARTVPTGMEPGSAVGCMSVLGYNPSVYYSGRAPIEARSMGISVEEGEIVFRCNLVSVRDGKMVSHSCGGISPSESEELFAAVVEHIGNDEAIFSPGISYRSILKLKGHEEAVLAKCTPPHDIPGQPFADFLPQGKGSELLRDMMARSETVLREHPVNKKRIERGDLPASMIWLFWGSGKANDMLPFYDLYGLRAALTSGVDLLIGLAYMSGMDVLEIAGVTDGPDNDYAAQAAGALEALDGHDMVVIHIEAPDEAGHDGILSEKIAAIEKIDSDVVGKIRSWKGDTLRMLVMPDHPTPIAIRTHTPEPVPFLLWGKGISGNGVRRFTEAEAATTGLFVDPGYNVMRELLERVA